MIDFKHKVILKESVFAQQVDDEMVLLDMDSENYFGLDSVGSAIWGAMQEHDTIQEVFDTLLEEYDVEPEVLQKDLFDFITKLEQNQLIKVEKL